MTSTLSYGHGFFSIKFKDINGKDAEVIEKNEIEARKLYTILRKVTDAKLFKHTDNDHEELVA